MLARSVLMVFLLAAPMAGAALPAPLQTDAGQPGDAPTTFAFARPLASPGVYAGELSYPLDAYDTYRVDFVAGTRYAFSFASLDGALLEIRTPEGASAGSTGEVTVSSVELLYTATTTGPHGLFVQWSGTAQAPYELGWGPAPALTHVDASPVVVATFDTGTNPFHPCWRRAQAHPHDMIPTYPASSTPLPLTFASTYAASLAASRPALDEVSPRTLYHVPGTSLSFYGADLARTSLVDDFGHGAQASSQIGCAEYGFAPNAQVVVLNWYDELAQRVELIDWVSAQPWIDVMHLNIQDAPMPMPLVAEDSDAFRRLLDAGKLVVIAAGNGVGGANYPMELTHSTGPAGSLIAGSIDNDGYAYYSNLDPHVVADGVSTVAAAADSFGSSPFGGTSSASPRVAGYAAWLLGEVRREWGHTGEGLLTIPQASPRPSDGPLADGRLTSAELHAIVRRTAEPDPSESTFDGGYNLKSIPPLEALPFAFYPKMGYGEVNERTLPYALAVLSGRAPEPERPIEDAFYEASETIRRSYWN